MALTPEQLAAYEDAVSNSLNQNNQPQQQPSVAEPVAAPAAAPAPKSSAVAPPVNKGMATGVNAGVSSNDMSQAMQNVTGAVTQGQGAMAPNMPFPEAKSPNSDMYSLAAPYAAGAGGLLAALYGGKKALEGFGKKSEEAPKVEPTMEGEESHEDYMKRMEREERLHQVRLAKAKADEAEAKIQAAKGGPASTEAVVEEPKIDLLAEIEKKHPHVAKAIKEGRVSIADETAAATQQTEPVESKQGIAPETPKETVVNKTGFMPPHTPSHTVELEPGALDHLLKRGVNVYNLSNEDVIAANQAAKQEKELLAKNQPVDLNNERAMRNAIEQEGASTMHRFNNAVNGGLASLDDIFAVRDIAKNAPNQVQKINETNKLLNLIEGNKRPEVTTATENNRTTAAANQNTSSEKTTLPEKQVSKGAAVPPTTSTTPTASLPEEWTKVNKGKGMTWLTSSMGPEGAQDFIERYNNGKPFESHQQMMDRFGEVVSKPSFSDIPKDVRKARGIETKQSGYKIVPGSKPPVSEGGFATPETLGGIGAGLLGAIDIAHTVKQANQAYKNGDYELAQAHANEIRNLHPLGLLYNQLFTKTPEDIEMMRKQSVFDKPEVKSSITRQVTSPRK